MPSIASEDHFSSNQRTVVLLRKTLSVFSFSVFYHTGWKCLPSLNPPALETNSAAESLSVSKTRPHSWVQRSWHILLASDMELHLFCWFISSAKTKQLISSISEAKWKKKNYIRAYKTYSLNFLFCYINNKSWYFERPLPPCGKLTKLIEVVVRLHLLHKYILIMISLVFILSTLQTL